MHRPKFESFGLREEEDLKKFDAWILFFTHRVHTHSRALWRRTGLASTVSSLLLALSWPTSRYLSSFWWHSSWYENSNFRSTSQVEERVIAVPVVQPGAISKEKSQANRVSSAGSSWRNGNALHDYYVHICQGVMSCWCNICCTKRMTEHLRIVFPSKGLQLKMCFALTDIVFPRRGAGSPTNCTQQRPSHRIGPQNIAIF